MFLEREGAAATSSKIPDPFYAMYSTIHGRIRGFINRRSKARTDCNHTLLDDEALGKLNPML